MLTLVLLPGMDGTGTLFQPLIEALGTEFQVVVVQYPPNESLNYSQLEAIARTALPADSPFVILGESFSGPIAISLAASCPTGLKGLVLCCPFVRNPRPIFSLLKSCVSLLPVTLTPMSLLTRILLGRDPRPQLRMQFIQALAQVAPSVIRARIQAILTVDVSAKLKTIGVPILYFRATHDRVIPPSASKVLVHLCPHAKIVTLDGPHLLLQTVPAEAATRLANFIREIPYDY